ncbi:MAG: hypothetical protein KKH83_06895 [Candidatus Margulisbacteria bacterium]|nr:hypothetical protein [Candidatus Margulisiibacteriota bacterium]
MNFYQIATLSIASLSYFLAVFILFKGRERTSNVLFALYSVAVGNWSLGKFLAWIATDPGPALLSLKFSIASAMLLPPLFLHFALFFVDRVRTWKIFLIVSYLFSFTLIFLTFFSEYVVSGVSAKWGMNYEIVSGTVYKVFFGFFIFLVLLAMVELWKGLKKQPYFRQVQIKYIIAAAVIGFGGGFLVFVSTLNEALAPVGYFFVPIYPLISAYVIIKHRLLDTDVFIRQSIVYTILTLMITALYLLTINLTREIFSSLFVVILFVLLFNPLRQILQNFIDRVFYRQQIDREAALIEFSKKVITIINLTELLEYIKTSIRETFKLTGVEIVLGSENREGLDLEIKGEKIGSVVIGKKMNGDDFSHAELEMIRVFLGTASAALSNALLHDEVLDRERELFKASRLATIGTLAAGMAHEIKNPLAAMKGMAQILPENINDREFIDRFVELVPRQIDRINRTVEDLLRVGKEPEEKIETFDLSSVLSDINAFFEATFLKKAINVAQSVQKGLMITADREQMYQVFFNLVQNAVQAMPEGGRLSVAAKKDGDRISITVADTGVGVDPVSLNKLFVPFYTTREGGTGLGLFMVERILKRLGGSIKIESTAGRGATARVDMPAQ